MEYDDGDILETTDLGGDILIARKTRRRRRGTDPVTEDPLAHPPGEVIDEFDARRDRLARREEQVDEPLAAHGW